MAQMSKGNLKDDDFLLHLLISYENMIVKQLVGAVNYMLLLRK